MKTAALLLIFAATAGIVTGLRVWAWADAEPAKGQGQCLYDRYRDERSRQGWAEFPWEKLTETQQLVWHRLVAAIKAGEVRP